MLKSFILLMSKLQNTPFKLFLIFLFHQRRLLVPLFNESFCHGGYVLSVFCDPVTRSISVFASQIIFCAKYTISCVNENPVVVVISSPYKDHSLERSALPVSTGFLGRLILSTQHFHSLLHLVFPCFFRTCDTRTGYSRLVGLDHFSPQALGIQDVQVRLAA